MTPLLSLLKESTTPIHSTGCLHGTLFCSSSGSTPGPDLQMVMVRKKKSDILFYFF